MRRDLSQPAQVPARVPDAQAMTYETERRVPTFGERCAGLAACCALAALETSPRLWWWFLRRWLALSLRMASYLAVPIALLCLGMALMLLALSDGRVNMFRIFFGPTLSLRIYGGIAGLALFPGPGFVGASLLWGFLVRLAWVLGIVRASYGATWVALLVTALTGGMALLLIGPMALGALTVGAAISLVGMVLGFVLLAVLIAGSIVSELVGNAGRAWLWGIVQRGATRPL